jgi:hypothetical protein
MMLKRRLRRQKQQREDCQASQQRLNFATVRVGPVIHLQSITLMAAIHQKQKMAVGLRSPSRTFGSSAP